jgi:ABC-type phosphate transport system substrate-binding protein
MKTRQIAAYGLIAVIITLLVCASCDSGGGGKPEPVEQPKDQSATISNLFGKELSVTIKGNSFTDEEWAGVPDKIKAAHEDMYAQAQGPAIQAFIEEVYSRGVTIIVEKTPSGYTKWKTTGDGKTLYLAYGELDNNLAATLYTTFQWMYAFEAETG